MEHALPRSAGVGPAPERVNGPTSSSSLRRLFRWAGALFSSLAVLAVLALLATTVRLHRMADDLGARLESLRLAEEVRAQVFVLQHARSFTVARNGGVRSPEEAQATDRLGQLAGGVSGRGSSDEERELLGALQTAIVRLLESTAVSPAGASTDRGAVETALEEALSLSEAVTRFELDLARAQRKHAGLHRIVATIAGGVALGLLLLPILFGRSLGSALFLPLDRMSQAIRSYTRDQGQRAPEVGSAEIQHIARTFNLAATEIQRQRENQVRFLAGVAHDLGKPLAALRGALDLVKPDPSREASVTRPLFIAKRSVDRVTATVEGLLDISRVELGELPVVRTQCDLRDIVRDTAERFEPGTSIIEVVLPGACIPAWCDARRIGQVLSNLVSNAVKYSPEGSVVCVKARKEGEAAVLEVIDTGIGVPPDERSDIFEPFRRSTLTRDTIPGVGLGLFISKKLVEAHGGELTVESTPGGGSTFRVSLPNAPLPPEGAVREPCR